MKLMTGLLAAVLLLAGMGASQAVVRIADDRGGKIGAAQALEPEWSRLAQERQCDLQLIAEPSFSPDRYEISREMKM